MHIDRVGSAWLVRRFLDPDATFGFVTDPGEVPDGAVPFDMPGVTSDDPQVLSVGAALFDGLYANFRRVLLQGRGAL